MSLIVPVLALLVAPAGQPQASCTELTRVAVLQDVSLSRTSTETPMLNVGDVDALVDVLEECGNFELAVGLIADRSRSWVRLAARPRPQPPVLVETRNPFAKAVERQRHAELTAQHQKELAQWQTAFDADRRAFRVEVEKLLVFSRAQRTDVFSALQRVDTFFSEDRAFARPARRLLVAVSDLQDNVRRTFSGFSSDATFCVVNGMGSVGVLAPAKPLTFDSFRPVLEFVRNWRAS